MWRKGFHCDFLLDVQAITIPVHDNVNNLACAMTGGLLKKFWLQVVNDRGCKVDIGTIRAMVAATQRNVPVSENASGQMIHATGRF